MGEHTDIQWADSTVNPTTGCDGCELWKVNTGGPCYAGNFHEQRLAKSLPKLYAPSFTEVRLAPGRMAKAAGWKDLRGTDRPDKPWLNGLPRMIFVGDMGDIFSGDVPFEYLRDELIGPATFAKGSRHIWMLLTKQPHRMAEFARWLGKQGVGWPQNVWAGTSVTKQLTARWRIRHLLEVPATRFISVEPQLERIDLHEAFFVGPEGSWEYEGSHRQMVSLVIIGGESTQSGHKARPFDVEWARDLIRQTREGRAVPFVKQLGSNVRWNGGSSPGEHWPARTRFEDIGGGWCVHLKDHHGGDPSEWPADLRDCRHFPQEVTPDAR